MADLSKPKKPTFKRGAGTDPKEKQLPYGAATSVNEAMAPLPFPDAENRPEAAEEPLEGLTDHDSILFQPSHRPQEPLTQGSPFGAGANVVQNEDRPAENDRDFLSRVATNVIGHPANDSRTKAFLARIARGE